jgi:hypothetical protein
MKKESFLHIKCTQEEKAAWVKLSQASGMKLTEWVILKLNSKPL